MHLMRKRGAWLLAAVLSASLCFADQLEFVVVNDTGGDIISLYASPASKEMWGDDILGREFLAQGGSVKVGFPHSAEWCIWDLQAEDKEKNTTEWREIDLCKNKNITLHGHGEGAWATVQ